MLYLYAITEACCTTDILPPGVNGIVPEILPFCGLCAVAARLHATPVCDAAEARRHMAVLAALMQNGTVLPARFGTTFDTRDDLDQAVGEMRDAALVDLQRLRGCVELGLTVTERGTYVAPTETPPLSGGPGACYMAAKYKQAAERLARDHANEVLAARLCAADGPLAGLAAETVWSAAPGRGAVGENGAPAISSAFLVQIERIGAFRATLSLLRSTEPHLNFLCTGPWPPFSLALSNVCVGFRLNSGASWVFRSGRRASDGTSQISTAA